ncbi:glycosyltransferase [Proteus faecis]|uniref:glycosyltransferase n=1 Tax=Proteus faecis TaxID=2050967 RepID=UPI003075E0AF
MKKILHIVGGLDMGGIERWLCNVLQYKNDFENTEFFILSMHPSKKNIVKDLNINEKNIFFSKKNNILSRIFILIKTIRKISPDIIHIHTSYSSAIYAIISKLFNVKKIIIHSHSDRRKIESNASFLRKFYIFLMKAIINAIDVKRIAVSEFSGLSLFKKNFNVMYCGVNLQDEDISIDILEKNKDKKLIFHIGRYTEAKNFPFIIEIMKNYKSSHNIYFVFIGSELEPLQDICNKNNLNKVIFLGGVKNPYSIMRKYASLFILPSKWEGLPLSAIEAQSAQVPTLISSNVTKETDIGYATFIPLHLQNWIQTIDRSLSLEIQNKDLDNKFSMKNNINLLNNLYSL